MYVNTNSTANPLCKKEKRKKNTHTLLTHKKRKKKSRNQRPGSTGETNSNCVISKLLASLRLLIGLCDGTCESTDCREGDVDGSPGSFKFAFAPLGGISSVRVRVKVAFEPPIACTAGPLNCFWFKGALASPEAAAAAAPNRYCVGTCGLGGIISPPPIRCIAPDDDVDVDVAEDTDDVDPKWSTLGLRPPRAAAAPRMWPVLVPDRSELCLRTAAPITGDDEEEDEEESEKPCPFPFVFVSFDLRIDLRIVAAPGPAAVDLSSSGGGGGDVAVVPAPTELDCPPVLTPLPNRTG